MWPRRLLFRRGSPTTTAAGPLLLSGSSDVQRWQLSRGRRWSEEQWRQASLEATQAGGSLSGPEPLRDRLLGALSSSSVQLVWTHEDHCFAGLRWRAHLSLPKRTLTLYERGLQELAERVGDRALATDLVLAHEVFHLLRPGCPGPLQEMAAHCFAQLLTGIERFPGVFDLPD